MPTWAAYRHDGHEHVGVVEGDSVAPLPGIRRIDRETGTDALRAATPDLSQSVKVSDVELLAPSWAPSKVFCVGLNYNDHVAETKRDLPTYPVLFPKYASSLIGPEEAIALPSESTQVDYEGELAVVIGRPGRRIAREEAMSHVLGYCVANDITMRDFQYKTHQWMQGKAWDRTTPMGPYLIDAQDFQPDESTGIRTFVDETLVQSSDLSRLIFDIPTLIATISEFTQLEAGDIILTGTPGGVGFRRDPQLFLVPGSRVRIEIDGVGILDNMVTAEDAS